MDIPDIDKLRVRFMALRYNNIICEEAWSIVVQVYEQSGFDHACDTMKGWWGNGRH